MKNLINGIKKPSLPLPKGRGDTHPRPSRREGFFTLHSLLFTLILVVMLAGCKSGESVLTMPEIHEYWHHTSDTTHQIDSFVDRQSTIIRELDSAAMAQYGIRLQGLQRAWLVESSRLQRELSELRQTKTDTVIIRDSVPVPYPVTKEVKKPLSLMEKGLMGTGIAALTAILIFFFIHAKKLFSFFIRFKNLFP